MSTNPASPPAPRLSIPSRLGAACLCAVALAAVVGCGSSKPAYCSSRSNLEKSVKGLTSLTPSSGLSGLQSQLGKIQSDANAVVTSAQRDFPNETNAIKSSVDALSTSVKSLSSHPSAGQIASVAGDAANVASSVKGFMSATSSRCG